MIWYDDRDQALCTFQLDSCLVFRSVPRTSVLHLLHYVYLHFGNTQRSTFCSVVTSSVKYVIFPIPFPKTTNATLAEIKEEVFSAKN